MYFQTCTFLLCMGFLLSGTLAELPTYQLANKEAKNTPPDFGLTRSDCDRCYPSPNTCVSTTVRTYTHERLRCDHSCCTVQFSVWGIDSSTFQVMVLDASNFAAYTGGQSYYGWSSQEFSCLRYPRTAPICSGSASGTDLFLVVVCKNALADCRLAYSASAENWVAPSDTPSSPCPKPPTELYILSIGGVIGLLALGCAILIWALKKCKEHRKLCWARCCNSGPEPDSFETLPLDDLADSMQ
jgi:hypothetical protein